MPRRASGSPVSRLFTREGARVAMLDRDEARLSKEAGAVGLVCDVEDERRVRAAVTEGASALGGLDGVVNCAGVDLMRPFEEMTTEEWTRVLAIDLTGPMLVCHAAVPLMKRAGRGTIVNVASGAGLRIELAASHRLPLMVANRQNGEAGGLVSYLSDSVDLVRRTAVSVDRILKGAKPGEHRPTA